jgi:hypothetical protein
MYKLFLLILMILVVYYVYNKYFKREKENKNYIIPKKIYTYWNTIDRPKIVDICIDSWRKYNPEYEIIIFNDESIENENLEYPQYYDDLIPAHKSDWIRVSLIEKYGGIWFDASILCTNHISSWVNHNENKLFGFLVPDYANIMENWAFAAPKNYPFISKWRNEFKNAIEMGLSTYKQVIGQSLDMFNKEEWNKIYNGMPYLTQHAAWLRTRQKHPDYDVKLYKSSEGPFHYLYSQNWNSYIALTYVLDGTYDYKKVPFLKLTRKEREAIDKYFNPYDFKKI